MPLHLRAMRWVPGLLVGITRPANPYRTQGFCNFQAATRCTLSVTVPG